MFKGSNVALITPFKNNGLDEEAYIKLIHFHINNGTSGLVPAGTTGESPTLSHTEHQRVIELCIKESNDKVPVIAGTGSNSTREAIIMTQYAQEAGADAALLVCPYYNKPSQEGLYQHYKSIAKETDLPIMLYSIPGRSVIEITVETQLRLHSDCPNIIAMKEAGGNKSRVMEIRKALPQKYEVLSGDDALTVEFIKNGAIGVVSVASNIIPKKLSELVDCLLNNKIAEAENINAFCQPLFQGLLSLDTNPIPIKEAMALCEMSTNELRLPLVGLNEANKSELVNLLAELNLLSNN